ncbi:MAG TPA: flagellar hook-basal body complex protein FliE [Alphaproteobacteria bacterium]|jgi:flagellar hook-basal body complex protein FliE|nr:flagellar hook-basal body complex protein FliE [Alphaproteobacteria bacterium]
MSNITGTPISAATAYAQAAKRAVEPGAGGEAPASASANFADLIKDSIGEAIETAKTSETTSLKSLGGKADVVDLVTAMNEAEMTLQTVVAVRDKVVQAYQEIMRMPI